VRTCPEIEPRRLVDWWCGDLDEVESARLEEHLVACDVCTGAGLRLAQLSESLGDLGELARLAERPVIDTSTLERIERAARTKVYRVSSGDAIDARISAAVEILVLRLQAPLEGLSSLDLELRGPDEQPYFTARDVPFDSNEIIMACHAHVALHSPEVRVCVVSRDASRGPQDEASGAREIARVTIFNHREGDE
jgi:hypothetical protein